MRKVLILLFITLLIAGCSQGSKGVKIDDDLDMQAFTFDEDDFKEAYEKNTGKIVPIGFSYNFSTIGVDDATAEQVESFLETAHDLLGDDVIQVMHKSFKEDREELEPGGKEWRRVESADRLFVDYGVLENGKYMSNVYLYVEPEGDE